jgi:Uma2 family endonuclease
MSLLLERPDVAHAALDPASAQDVTMSSLLEMPEVRAQLFPVSIDIYHRLTDDLPTELLRGVIIKKLSKSPKHRSKGHKIHWMLAPQIGPGFVIFQEAPLTLVDSEPEPDVSVVRGLEAEFEDKHPATAELVVEVAVTSLTIDRLKAAIYAEAGVAEYWIVVPDKKQVEVFRQPVAGAYAETLILTAPALLHSSALPGVSVDLAALFA